VQRVPVSRAVSAAGLAVDWTDPSVTHPQPSSSVSGTNGEGRPSWPPVAGDGQQPGVVGGGLERLRETRDGSGTGTCGWYRSPFDEPLGPMLIVGGGTTVVGVQDSGAGAVSPAVSNGGSKHAAVLAISAVWSHSRRKSTRFCRTRVHTPNIHQVTNCGAHAAPQVRESGCAMGGGEDEQEQPSSGSRYGANGRERWGSTTGKAS